jgi:uncharacterized protein
MIFVDTGAWFARHVPSDPDHQRVKAFLDTNSEPLITTDYCVDETLTLLAARKRHRLALEVGNAFFGENVSRIHFVSPEQIRRAWILFQSRAATGWSFTDCTSKVVIDELKIEIAVAIDAHFRQFGIRIVP